MLDPIVSDCIRALEFAEASGSTDERASADTALARVSKSAAHALKR